MGWNISSHEWIQVSHTINRDPSFQQQQHQQYNDNNRNSSNWLNVYSARDGAKGSICISRLIWRHWSTYSSLSLQMKRCRHKKLYNLLLKNGETGVQTQTHEIIQPRILNIVRTIILLNSSGEKKYISVRYCLMTHPGLWAQEKEWTQEAAPGIEIQPSTPPHPTPCKLKTALESYLIFILLWFDFLPWDLS